MTNKNTNGFMVALRCLAATLLLGTFAGATSAAPAPESGFEKARAALNFVIRIPPMLRMTTLWARDTIEVPAANGARAIAVSDAASFEVQSNMKAYELRFHITDPDVVAVEVEGLQHAVTVPREGLSLRFDARADIGRMVRRELAYRIILAAGAKAGPRRMPVMYSVHAGA
jgi:hypothetical protein